MRKNISKQLNYVLIYYNSDFSRAKNKMIQGKYFSDDFHCLFCHYCRNKHLSIVVLLQQNSIRQKYQVYL